VIGGAIGPVETNDAETATSSKPMSKMVALATLLLTGFDRPG
jgi:hypothetical protein